MRPFWPTIGDPKDIADWPPVFSLAVVAHRTQAASRRGRLIPKVLLPGAASGVVRYNFPPWAPAA